MDTERLLSIQDVAEKLSLQYRTVYRLVVSGQIPAARIGGVYRVRPSDLEAYIEGQRSPGTQETPACARCGALFTTASQVGGKCSEPSCDLPLCASCWERVGDRFCREHARGDLAMTYEEAREKFRQRQIKVLVTAERARQMELTFMSRFEQAVESRRGIRSPVDGTLVEVNDWRAIRRSEPLLLPRWEAAPQVVSYAAKRQPMPVGETAVYYVGAELSGGRPFAVGAVCLAHLAAYRSRGFDTTPATHAELLGVLSNALDLVRIRDTTLVVGLASPTGWEESAQEAIVGSSSIQSFIHARLAVCLVDLSERAVFYSPAESKLTHAVEYFVGELDEEKVRRVCDYVRKALASRLSQSREEVARATGASFDIVDVAFSRLEAGQEYSVQYDKRFGRQITLRQGA